MWRVTVEPAPETSVTPLPACLQRRIQHGHLNLNQDPVVVGVEVLKSSRVGTRPTGQRDIQATTTHNKSRGHAEEAGPWSPNPTAVVCGQPNQPIQLRRGINLGMRPIRGGGGHNGKTDSCSSCVERAAAKLCCGARAQTAVPFRNGCARRSSRNVHCWQRMPRTTGQRRPDDP